MLAAVSRYWRHLFCGKSPSDRQRMSRITGGSLEVVAPPSGFTPREGAGTHEEVMVQGRDVGHDLDAGDGILIVTNRAIVFFTSRKRWRVPWRSVERAVTKRNRTLQVKTGGGKSFAFELSSASDAEVIGAAVV